MNLSASQIEAELTRLAGVEAAIELDSASVVVTGLIESEDQRIAAIDIIMALAPGRRIIDNLEVVGVLPEEIDGMELSDATSGRFAGATPGTEDDEALEPGDFTDQDLLENALGAAGPSEDLSSDDEISEGDESYIPPIDPPMDREGEFLGGFQTSAMDDVEVEPSSDGTLGDEAIADAIRNELHEDAATTDLEVRVIVRRGLVRLRGSVPTLDDAESAEEVAYRVPGVVEVIDELTVEDLA